MIQKTFIAVATIANSAACSKCNKTYIDHSFPSNRCPNSHPTDTFTPVAAPIALVVNATATLIANACFACGKPSSICDCLSPSAQPIFTNENESVATNNHICPSCNNDRVSKTEKSCWKCGSKL